MVGEARAAQASADDDDRLESLVGFLHVAQESDDFGFDLLGYLSPYAGSDPRPLLLEVKNSANRQFIASMPNGVVPRSRALTRVGCGVCTSTVT